MTTLERLQELIAKEFGIEAAKLTPAARLEDLDIDSLRMIEIVFCVEDAFGITVAAVAPTASAPAIARIGRSRLPPASTL